MKKLLIFFSAIILLSGCSKDRVCKCTGNTGYNDYEFTFAKTTKRNAEEGCKNYAATWSTQYKDCQIQ